MTNQQVAPGALRPIARYKIGYRSDEWGMRSSTPGGVSDPAGQWVRYDDHIAALASAAAPAPQPNTAYAALPDTYYLAGGEVKTWDENHMRAFADATCALRIQQPSTTPQADSQPAPSTDQVEEILRERDDAEDFIDVLLDEVLGHERPEWSSAYGRADALNDVQERMTALHKPAVDKAWDQFQSAMAADSVLEDAARLDWLLLHISGAEFRRIGVHYSGNARRADVDAARKQGANHD